MSRFFHYDEKSNSVKEGHAPIERRVAGWPALECYASGVAPQQAQELRDFFKKHNESVDVTNKGNPVYTSAGQRKRLLKLRNLCDKSAFC